MKAHRARIFGSCLIVILAQCAVAQATVILNEPFNYADLAALQANWGATAGLGLDLVGGNPSPSATHSGANTIHSWVGNGTFSITPTDANPIVFTADIWDSGTGNQRNTVGLRTGANPLFEMGMYNSFNDPGPGSGEGVRLVSLAGSQNWHQMGPFTTGWSRWEATFTTYSVTIRVDTGIDSTWDLNWTSTGVTPIGAFSDLRFGGPSGVTSPAAFAVDNIRLEVTTVPEPSALALSLLGGLGLAAISRRRKA
jgi:PEP-CTERM motif